MYYYLLLEMKVFPHLKTLQKISQKASEELVLEKILTKMQMEWRPMVFDMTPATETFPALLDLVTIDSISTLVEPHITRTYFLKFSEHIRGYNCFSFLYIVVQTGCRKHVARRFCMTKFYYIV